MADGDTSHTISSGRMDGFSDGVFSIAATLLVLEDRAGTGGHGTEASAEHLVRRPHEEEFAQQKAKLLSLGAS